MECNEDESIVKFKVYLPILTSPDELYSVPKCGPDSDRKVYKRGNNGLICGLDRADLTIIVPSECATNDILLGFIPYDSIWYKISPTRRSVIVSKSENVSPWFRSDILCAL